MELFATSGNIVFEGYDLFADVSWLQVMLGQGLEPRSYHPLTNQITDQQLDEHLDYVETRIDGIVEGMPLESDFIRNHCTATGE